MKLWQHAIPPVHIFDESWAFFKRVFLSIFECAATNSSSGRIRFPMSLFSFFADKKDDASEQKLAAHLTFGSAHVTRTLSRTSVFFRKQTWIWPILAILLLTVIGTTVRNSLERSTGEILHSQLSTLLAVETAMVREWMEDQQIAVGIAASDSHATEVMLEALQSSTKSGGSSTDIDQQRNQQLNRDINEMLRPILESNRLTGFFVANQENKVILASETDWLGKKVDSFHHRSLDRAEAGETVVSAPTDQPLFSGEQKQAGAHPVMYVCTAILDSERNTVGYLAMTIDPTVEFSRIFEFGRLGTSGETYAFNKHGFMVSRSRFEDDLIRTGFLPDHPDATSMMTLALRDPGQNTLTDGRPAKRPADMPLTRMAASAIAGETKVELNPYRDYRGVPVLGAWTWLPEMEIGIACEMDQEEAFSALWMIRVLFGGLFGLLAVAAIAIFGFSIAVSRLRKEAQKNAVEARELGQYRLEKKLGAGAMGVVYKGYHAMLRRATAIKLLKVELIDESSIKRFENEVQIACQLTHPNTISIYDYGQTPEGVFYYAMEFLDGLDLQELVVQYGPLPEGRVIHILRQVCGSLYEAHTRGLVHRDIKPSNIMLNQRGGETDVVKVLDFGLARALNAGSHSEVNPEDAVDGTALYMSPEAIQTPGAVDARSDVYALGAVGYYLLTGQPVFNADNVVGILQQHVSAMPLPPSIRVGKPISEELENIILGCLSKNPAQRPESMRSLADMLEQVPTAHSWTREEGERWGSRVQRGLSPRKNRLARSVTNKFEQTLVNISGLKEALQQANQQNAALDDTGQYGTAADVSNVINSDPRW